MELRDIEIFLTLSEELHFGRTAARLYVSQARVSQAIGQQERRLGATLFERTSRTVRLTPVGRQLRDDLAPVLAGLRMGLERARLTAQGVRASLRVGLNPLNAADLRPYWDTFRARHPQWQLSVQQSPFVDPFAGLRAGDLDILITWLPVAEPDLTVGPLLFSDSRVLAVAADHELTRFTSTSLEMAADFQHPAVEPAPDYWLDGYLPPHTRGGRMIERGRLIRNTEEALTLVSMGEIVCLYPGHMTRYAARPDITYLPVRDMDALQYAAVWRTESENDPIRAFVRTVRDLGPLPLSEP